jgi:hypothetical protein
MNTFVYHFRPYSRKVAANVFRLTFQQILQGYLRQYSVCLRPGRPGNWGSILGRDDGFFLFPRVQIGSGAHPASCTMGTGGPFPGGKERPGRDADHSPPSSAQVVNE